MKLSHLTVRRFASLWHRRRGSMLIMVVVILVLLALIGTAMISTSRIDRLGTAQHSANTQIDLLVESVKNLAIGAIVDDLFGTNPANLAGAKMFRPPGELVASSYKHWDSVGIGVNDDAFLGARLPLRSAGVVGWVKSTNPLLSGVFESPYSGGLTSNTYGPGTRAVRHVDLGTKGKFPGLYVGPTASDIVLAGDADADGIADGGMFRIPIGELNGVGYYASVRIIDNNSTINASIAWSGQNDYSFASAAIANNGLFPSNVGLRELLTDPAEMDALNRYRFNTTAATPVANQAAFSDLAVQRTDFNFLTQGDALGSQLARRLDKPSYRTATLAYKALPLSEAISMANRFCLKSSTASPSTLETAAASATLPGGIPASVYTNALINNKPYQADDYANWFTRNFDFDLAGRPLRTILTSRNGVSNATPAHDMSLLPAGYVTVSNEANKMPAYFRNAEVVPKTSVNTAAFNKLWRGFWNVMCLNASTAPHVYVFDTLNPTLIGGRMFRPVLRNPTTPAVALTMTSTEVMMLRAAIAAVNTMDLRDSDYHVTTRRVFLYNSTSPADIKYEAMIFGGEPQPFITEIYANTDVTVNPKGYVAVELHNPYPFAISLANWKLARAYRQTTGTGTVPPSAPLYPNMKLMPLTNFTGFPAPGGTAPVIPAGGFCVLENFPNGATPVDPTKAATARPPEVVITPSATVVTYYVESLHEVLGDPTLLTDNTGGELVLLRPRRAVINGSGVLENDQLCRNDPADALNVFDETVAANLHHFVPVDQFDFTGISLALAPATTFGAWHYVRENKDPDSAVVGDLGHKWKFVYPGAYTASAISNRHGAQTVAFDPSATPPGNTNPWDPAAPNFLAPSPVIALGLADSTSTYSNLIPPIQWHNTDMAGPLKAGVSPAVNQFPFGGFARNGDMLQIPYIGAYRLRATNSAGVPVVSTDTFLEMNSVSMDAMLAEDGDTTNDNVEMLGKFFPLTAADPVYAGVDHYSWASDLFDHFSATVPSEDYFPNVDPNLSDVVQLANSTVGYMGGNPRRYPGAPAPDAVQNSGSYIASSAGEAVLPTEGLINLNTAPWPVLAALPWLTTMNGVDRIGVNVNTGVIGGPNGVPDNADVARLIAAWRDGEAAWAGTNAAWGTPRGPFQSIFDLNKIIHPGDTSKRFQNGFGTIPTDPGDVEGDFSPLGVATDQVSADSEERALMINRISNLVSLRSDTFTVYVLVQGWRGAGTTAPELVVQRRAALIVDRNTVTPTTKKPSVINVPTE